jgi:hexosaminidase
MTDFYHSYLSQIQGSKEMEPEGPNMFLPLSKVYALNPIPEELTAEEANNVLGVEACLWGEFTPSEEHCEYMLYPRSLANAEVAWTKNKVKSWSRFQTAVEANLKRLERDNVNYSNSMYSVYVSFALNELSNMAMVYLNTETVGYDMYYTTNGDEPTINSTKYVGVFNTKNRNTVKAALFNKDGKLLGRITELKIK